MNEKNELFGRIEERFNTLDLKNYEKHGIYKYRDYAFIYSYPPVQALRKLTPRESDSVDFGNNEGINLYIHIPYCTGNCVYCYFSKIIDNSKAILSKDEYVRLLEKEIIQYKNRTVIPEIKTIHVGGGTPSCLTENQIAQLFQVLAGNLKLSEGLEITFECSPETILADDGPAKLKTMRQAGVNRINVGIESLDNEVLKIMKRRHKNDKALRAIETIKNSGFDNVNVDIMYGLPTQSLSSWYDTLRQLLSYNLESISTYRLRFHPQKEISAYPQDLLPGYEDSIRMYLLAQTLLLDHHYIQAASHKFSGRHNLVQKQILKKRGVKGNNVLGLGCSSYGFINNKFYWNHRNIVEYKESIDKNELPIWIGEILNEEESARKAFVLGLHLPKGINKKEFKERFGESPEEMFREEWEPLAGLNLIENSDEHLYLNENGLIFADEICIKFYSKHVKDILGGKSTRYGMFFELADYN